MRSWLLIPADSEKKLSLAPNTGADVLVIDIAGVRADRKAAARAQARQWLAANRQTLVAGRDFKRWVMISPLGTPNWRADLEAAVAGGCHGIIQTGVSGADQTQTLAADLYELEQAHSVEHESVQICPLLGEDPAGALNVARYADASIPRLGGLAWSASGLLEGLGVMRGASGASADADAVQALRANIVLTARARGVFALESAVHSGRKTDEFEIVVANAAANGFDGMFATHPRQVGAINAAFGSEGKDVRRAAEIVAKFDAEPGATSVEYDGRPVLRTHLPRLRRLALSGGR